MRREEIEQFRLRFPALGKDILEAVAEVMIQAREVCGDVDTFLVLLVVALRSYEDPVFRRLTMDEYLEGGWMERVNRYTNIQSIAESTGMPKETARRKVALLTEKGWLERRGRRLALSEEGVRRVTPVREAILRLSARAHDGIEGLVKDGRR